MTPPSTINSCDKKKVNFFVIEKLTLSYRKKILVQDLSFSLHSGDSLSIMGPNGSGKTTLLKTLVGLVPPVSGTWGWKTDAHTVRPLLHQDQSYFPQHFEGLRDFPITVQDVAHMGRENASPQDVFDALERVKLLDFIHQPIAHLSTGQFQRMLFARLYLQNKTIIFLDEPFAGLDDYTIQDLLDIIHQWEKEGKIILLSQHDRSRALSHFSQSLLLGPCPTYHFGNSQDVLSLNHWHTAHERIHTSECC